MAEIQKDTMTAADAKKPADDAKKNAPEPQVRQTTNPELAPNVPATDAMMSSGGRDGQVIPGTAAKHAVPTGSLGASNDKGANERSSNLQARAEENAAQRAAWQEQNATEPVKAVAPQKGKF